MDSSNIEPYSLNTNQYAKLKNKINSLTINNGYGNLTLDETLQKYMTTTHFKTNYNIVKKNGREASKTAISRIMNGVPGQKGIIGLGMTGINNQFIERGENEWIREQGVDLRKKQVEIKRENDLKYKEEYKNSLSESDFSL